MLTVLEVHGTLFLGNPYQSNVDSVVSEKSIKTGKLVKIRNDNTYVIIKFILEKKLCSYAPGDKRFCQRKGLPHLKPDMSKYSTRVSEIPTWKSIPST